MRYADGPTTEATVRIAAPPEVVWGLVTDIEVPARFSSELQAVEWLDETSFRGRNAHAAVGEWETTSFVVERDEPTAFTWAVSDPAHPSAMWGYRLEPDGDGTLLTHWMRMGPAPSGLTPAIEAMPDKEERIIERRLGEHRANMEATLEGIKGIAEER